MPRKAGHPDVHRKLTVCRLSEQVRHIDARHRCSLFQGQVAATSECRVADRNQFKIQVAQGSSIEVKNLVAPPEQELCRDHSGKPWVTRSSGGDERGFPEGCPESFRDYEAGVPNATTPEKTIQISPHFVAVGCDRREGSAISSLKSGTWRDVERVKGIEPKCSSPVGAHRIPPTPWAW